MLILLSFFTNTKAENPDNEQYRVRFYESVNDANKAKKFLKELAQDKNTAFPIIQGYQAAVHMVMANHVFNPYSKFKFFLDGKEMLEKAIQKDPQNLELRFIRLSIQTNIPSFLGYKDNIHNDKTFILQNCKYLDPNKKGDRILYGYIKAYFTENNLLSDAERKDFPEM